MDNTINIRNNFPAVAAALERVADDAGNKAMVRALNATVDQGKIQMARQISQEFRLSVATAKDRLAVHKASARGNLRFEAVLEATRKGKGRSMNLIAFVEQKVTLAEAKRRAKKGTLLQLRVQIKRTGGQKIIPGAFIATMRNDHEGVFIRIGKGRLPIKALNTIDVEQMFNTQRINRIVKAAMLQRFEANFKRELRVVLGGFAR